tara:strand:- start:906 stop:1697 length:792 start_codon:yes stop_codon:yes gene_type:complete
MIILSVDIGIKNLGYVIFKLDNNKMLEIIDWNIINLCEYNPKCSICQDRSDYMYDNQYYCKRHVKELDREINLIILENKTKKELIEICKMKYINIDTKLKRDLIREILKKYFNDNYINSIDNKTSQKVTIVDIGINLKLNLNKIFSKIEISAIDNILIENQIGPLANRMKTVQGMVAQYFIDNNNYNVEFVSSKNKLSQFTNEKMSYKEKKKKSVEIVKQIITKHNSKYISFFNSNKKQDDLADSLLQGLSYIKKYKKIDIVL